MNIARQQHEVPRFYLERFASKHTSQVESYDLMEKRSVIQLPEKLARLRDAYVFTLEDGTRDHSVDQILQTCESNGAALYDKVLSGGILTHPERAKFAEFIASMYIRGPFHLRNFGQMLGKYIRMVAHVQAKDDDLWAEIEEFQKSNPNHAYNPEVSARIRERWRDGVLNLNVARESTLRAFGALPEFARAISEMNWTIARASRGDLITSDSPVVMSAEPGAPPGGLRSPGTILTFPLTSSVCWVGAWSKRRRSNRRISSVNVRELNVFRALDAERRLFAEPFMQNLAAIATVRDGSRNAFTMHGLGSNLQGDVNVVRKLKQKKTGRH